MGNQLFYYSEKVCLILSVWTPLLFMWNTVHFTNNWLLFYYLKLIWTAMYSTIYRTQRAFTLSPRRWSAHRPGALSSRSDCCTISSAGCSEVVQYDFPPLIHINSSFYITLKLTHFLSSTLRGHFAGQSHLISTNTTAPYS